MMQLSAIPLQAMTVILFSLSATAGLAAEKKFELKPWHSLQISGPFEVEWKSGDAYAAVVEASSRDLELVLLQQTKSHRLDIAKTGLRSFDVDVKMVELEGSGAIEVDMAAVTSERLTVDLSGASTVKVGAVKSIGGKLSGAASLSYKGAAAVDVSASGAASVRSY